MARIRKSQKETIYLDKAEKKQVCHIAVYIRLSREDGNAESESVINQKKIIIEYLENTFEEQFVIVDFYIDDGLTGTDDTRANFMRMNHDIDLGKVDCVICKTLARAFRNYSDQGYYLEYLFPQKNVRFISIGDPHIDTFKNPEAITGLEVPITGLMNDRFAGKTSNDVRRTFNTKRRKGEFIGAFPPYGYLKNPKNKNHLILDKEIYQLKRDMRNWIVHESMSLNGVAHKLNELGIPNPTAYKQKKGWNYCNPQAKTNDGLWSGTTVKRILIDKVNLGHMIQGKQKVISYKVHDRVSVPEEEWFIVYNTHEPTFTQEEYDELENILKRDTRTPNGSKKVHLFSGFMRCFNCQKALQRCVAKNHVYYACRTYRQKSKIHCTKHTIRADLLEEAVFYSIQTQITLVEDLAKTIDKINSNPIINTKSSKLESLLNGQQQELKKLRNASDNLYIDWKSEEITTDDYRRMKQKFDEQIQKIMHVITNLEEEKRITSNGIRTENTLFSSFLKHRNIEKLERGVLISLVDKIYVHEDKRITIKYKHADQYQRVLEYIKANINVTVTPA
jgi:hypothetical protein